MARTIFVGSVLFCALFLGLSQIPDPDFFGVRDEPSRLLFYGGTGVLAGLFGLITTISGTYLVLSKSANISQSQRRLILFVLSMVVIAVVVFLTVRSGLVH